MNTAKRTHEHRESLPLYREGSEATQGAVTCNARRAEQYRHAQNGETAVGTEPCNEQRYRIDGHAQRVATAGEGSREARDK